MKEQPAPGIKPNDFNRKLIFDLMDRGWNEIKKHTSKTSGIYYTMWNKDSGTWYEVTKKCGNFIKEYQLKHKEG